MLKISNFISTFAIGAGALCTYPLDGALCSHPADAKNPAQMEQAMNILEKRVSLLENDQTFYGPITVSKIIFNNSKHFAVVNPGQTIDCSFHYRLDASKQDFLSKNHLIVGLAGVAAEDCATHLYGVWNSEGNADFKLTAPLEEGDYEVRIAYRPGQTCQEALNSWTILHEEPGSFATIGILRVRTSNFPSSS